MNTSNTASAIVSQYQLDICLETARDAIVDCEAFLRTSAPDHCMKAVRQIRKRLYGVFVQADDSAVSAFALTKQVEECIKLLKATIADAPPVVH